MRKLKYDHFLSVFRGSWLCNTGLTMHRRVHRDLTHADVRKRIQKLTKKVRENF